MTTTPSSGESPSNLSLVHLAGVSQTEPSLNATSSPVVSTSLSEASISPRPSMIVLYRELKQGIRSRRAQRYFDSADWAMKLNERPSDEIPQPHPQIFQINKPEVDRISLRGAVLPEKEVLPKS